MPPDAPVIRRIIHVDMDAFYAAVEQRDRPELRGKPVVVGGPPQSRGVVCTASYEARRFGIHSAMPSFQAGRLCPGAVFLRPDFEKYRQVSRQIRTIFEQYTDLVEPLSLDEAYLDVTSNHRGIPSGTPSGTLVAQAIRREIEAETALTASAGVGPNKFIAKVASDMDKPDGLVVVPPDRVSAFLHDLPVRKVPGIGRVTESRCHELGIEVCSDFLRFGEDRLTQLLGSSGRHYHNLAQGIDPRPVKAHSERKSCSIEDTFPRDLTSHEEVLPVLQRLAAGLERRLRKNAIRGRTVTLKVKYSDFRQITRSRSVDMLVRSQATLLRLATRLLEETDVGRKPIRLLGIGVSQLVGEGEAHQGVFPFHDDTVESG